MKNAIDEYNKQDYQSDEQGLSLCAIARAYNVPKETMRRRIKGKMTRPTFDIHAHQLGIG
jgi:hypothetical protein